MDGGEKLAYARDAIADISIEFEHSPLLFGYDIACRLEAHMTKRAEKHKKDSLPMDPTPYLYFLPLMHAYVHGYGCQCRFSQRHFLGLGLIAGEGHEQTLSDLSRRNIGSTQRETVGNRRLDVTSLFEAHSRDQAGRYFQGVQNQIFAALAELASVMHESGNDTFDHGTYEQAVVANKKQRQQQFRAHQVLKKPAESKSTSEVAADEKEQSRQSLKEIRQQIDGVAAVIRKVELSLKKKQGTTLTAKFRTVLKRERQRLNTLIVRYNNTLTLQNKAANPTDLEDESQFLDAFEYFEEEGDEEPVADEDDIFNATGESILGVHNIQPTSTAANTGNQSTAIDSNEPLTIKAVFSELTMEARGESLTSRYWRGVEQIYFSTCDLLNGIAFYEHRVNEMWPKVRKWVFESLVLAEPRNKVNGGADSETEVEAETEVEEETETGNAPSVWELQMRNFANEFFYQNCEILVEEAIQRDIQALKCSGEVADLLSTEQLLPYKLKHVKEVERGFRKGIHRGSHDL
ncbi:hypothetical protein HDU76_002245 [Blyttiomyces sp. JEL0837]|nr:hypothetical protein HDU76_002245 [Blyttiomyces sp. JEL0837]